MRRIHAVAALLGVLLLGGCRVTDTNAAGDRSADTGKTAALPNVVGTRLSDAFDRLKAAGFKHLRPTDGTGQGRVPVNFDNWVVRSQAPAAGGNIDKGATVTLAVRKPSDGDGGPSVTAGVVPNVVCKDLQSARDTLKGAGYSNLGSADGADQGRKQIVNRNWVVIAQSVAPGGRPDTDARIVLTAVKFGEPTGRSGCRS